MRCILSFLNIAKVPGYFITARPNLAAVVPASNDLACLAVRCAFYNLELYKMDENRNSKLNTEANCNQCKWTNAQLAKSSMTKELLSNPCCTVAQFKVQCLRKVSPFCIWHRLFAYRVNDTKGKHS